VTVDILLVVVAPFVLIVFRRPMQRSFYRKLQSGKVSDFQKLAGGWTMRVDIPPEQAVGKAASGLTPWKSARASQKVTRTEPAKLSIEVGNAAYRWLECQLVAGVADDGVTVVRFTVPHWREQAGVPVAGDQLRRISVQLQGALAA
jgi:hypothetical protein